MALTTSEKQLSNRILNQMDSEKRRRLRKLTDTLEEVGSTPEIPFKDYKARFWTLDATGLSANGVTPALGTGTTAGVASRTTTNKLTRLARNTYTGATSTSSVGGYLSTNVSFSSDSFFGNISDGAGFIYTSVTGGSGFVGTSRMFVGYRSANVSINDLDPSTLINIVGIGFDAADTQVSFICNDGSGVATKIPLGPSFPKPTSDLANMYLLEMSCLDGTTVQYSVRDLITGAFVSGEATSNLPANNAVLGITGYVSAGGTSTASRIDVVNVTEIQPNIW